MENKHLIMGTAGHIDHGKTAVVKALTGFDCDTHKQEKDRGITINLGFTHFDLADGNSIGIVDVPGHADFIKTMVAGACGIDFVLLVISADEGIMPQTREHLEIMKILEIRYGMIVLTKLDLVDEELAELAEEETKDFVEGTFLHDAQIHKVSSLTKQGLDDLKAAISNLVENIPSRNSKGDFRMYIDRLFTRPGFGTIVNGSVLSGVLNKKQPVYLLPGSKELRIRRIERHGNEVGQLKAGDRASLNLIGLKHKDFERGMLIAGKQINETKMLDAKLFIFKNASSIGLWSQVVFLLGTVRVMVRMHLLDKDELKSEEQGIVQIYLPKPVIAQIGDHFIIRNSSGDLTLGGGTIIDPYPLHHRRRRKEQIEIVKKISSGILSERIAAEVKKSVTPVSHLSLAEKLDIDPDEMINTIFNELPKGVVFFQENEHILLLLKKMKIDIQNKILNMLTEHHKKNPLMEEGKTFQELTGVFGKQQDEMSKLVLTAILKELEEKNKIRKIKKTWILTTHEIKIDEKFLSQINLVEKFLENAGSKLADMKEMFALMTEKGISENKLKQILKYLMDQKKIYFIKQIYLHADLVENSRQLLIDFLKKNEQGITVARFRDLIDSNRVTSLLLLEFFDNEGITLRKDNVRVFRKSFNIGIKKLI